LGNLKARFAASSLWFSRFESNGFAAKVCAALTGVYSFFKTENQKYASRHRPWWFLRVAALPPKHVLCTLESIPDFKQHPCCLTYFLATAQESKQRKPLTTKVFNRTKKLILRSLQMCPSNFRSNGILAICP
tara:strand:- start:1698 stop:2093 length:396 start_codon:yes stop_codon:yes gene_type:complete